MSGISVGLNRGFIIHKLSQPKQRVKAPTRKQRFIKEVTREVVGFAPYERRLIDLCRNNLDKRALRLAKRKLGSHKRAKAKREEMSGVAFKLRQEAAKRAADDKAGVKAKAAADAKAAEAKKK